MALSISSQYTRVTNFWTAWKAVQASKNFLTQYFDDGTVYNIWGYDGPDIHFCQIYKGTVPQDIIDSGQYTQVQNDSDKTDFTTNFQPTANAKQSFKSNTSITDGGVEGAITVGTSATEAKAGGSRLNPRQYLGVLNNSSVTIYWGFTSGVTTSTGTPIAPGQYWPFDISGLQPVYLIAGTAGNNVRITESR